MKYIETFIGHPLVVAELNKTIHSEEYPNPKVLVNNFKNLESHCFVRKEKFPIKN